MTEYELLEEYVMKILDMEKKAGVGTNTSLVGDLLHYFTNNVPAYNKELEEENAVLKEQLDLFMDFNRETGFKALDMVGIIEKQRTLKELRGK